MTVRAALYARASHSHPDTDEQLDELREFAIEEGWRATTYTDEEFSGPHPGWRELLGAVRRGAVDVVLVTRFDRVARSTVHLGDLLEDLRRRDVRFISLGEKVDTATSRGRITLQVLASVSRFERDLARERARSGMARARAGGKRIGRPPAQHSEEARP